MKLKILGILLLALVGIVLALPQKAQAASWDPGRIIDDGKFTNKNSMTPVDIQNFLNSKVPSCDTWHSPGSGAQGANPPWTCLKDYSENGVNSANIIWNAAQTYSINPQVLIVTLQKENGLITDTWPYPWQYRTAMGFACPDNGSCDPAFYGFTNQVNQAARHFRNFYDQNPNWFIPFHPGNNFIQWSPNGSCGGSNVNIVTRGTAALYSYTPYQPNQAALNNLYGTGDGCSAYGNRNFWRDYNNWFGSTSDGPYQWTALGVNGSKDLNNLAPGDSVSVTVSAKNTGATTWNRDGANQVNLATANPNGRTSQFQGSGWINSATAAKLNEASVAPGQTGTFTFNIVVPPFQGSFDEGFNLVAQGVAWFADPGFSVHITVPSGYHWSYNSQAAYTDSSKTTPANVGNLSPGQTAWLVVKANNVGQTTWYNSGANPVTLATDRTPAHVSRFASPAWINNVTPVALKESSVAPGQTGTFEFPIQVPVGAGTFTEYFNLIAQGQIWFNQDVGQYFSLTVKQDYRWSFNAQGAYTDSSKTTPVNVNNLSPGQTAWLMIRANNVGQTTWYKTGVNQVNLATDQPFAHANRFATNAWLNSATPVGLNEISVAPGQSGTFEFPIQVPVGSGTFKEYFNPVAQGITAFNNNVGQYFPLTVNQDYRWSFNTQGAYTDSSKTTPINLGNLTAGQTAWLVVKANNVGQTTWFKTGNNQVNLATDKPAGRISPFTTSGWLNAATPTALIEQTVPSGQVGTFEFPIKAPVAGLYLEYFNPVAQGIMFFNTNVGQFFPITVH